MTRTNWNEEIFIKYLNENNPELKKDIFNNNLYLQIKDIVNQVYEKSKSEKFKINYDEFFGEAIYVIYENISKNKLDKIVSGKFSGKSYIKTIVKSVHANHKLNEYKKMTQYFHFVENMKEN